MCIVLKGTVIRNCHRLLVHMVTMSLPLHVKIYMRPLKSFLPPLSFSTVWTHISSSFWAVSVVHFSVCVCVCQSQYFISTVWLSWRWEACIVAGAAWSSSTGNASNRSELTETRCLRLLAGGFSLWNKSVSWGSSLPPLTLLSSIWTFCLLVLLFILLIKTSWCKRRLRKRKHKEHAMNLFIFNSHSFLCKTNTEKKTSRW